MRNRPNPTCLICGFLLAAGQVLAQDTIDLETRPDGLTPVDDQPLPLTAAYTVDGINVTFGLDSDLDGTTDTPAVFEIIGDDGVDGFGTSSGADRASSGFEAQLGDWFLRSPGDFSGSGDPGIFVIDYSQPVIGVAGEIWDIDASGAGTEAWIVRAIDVNGVVLQTIRSPEPLLGSANAFDGQPWIFSIADSAGISRVELDFDGTKDTDIGLAFNNYRATTAVSGPRLLVSTPSIPSTEPNGVERAIVYWDEAVVLTEDDVTVVDQGGDTVEVSIASVGDTAHEIIFRSEPGGSQQMNPVPLISGQYTVTIADSARAADNNAPIDGDGNGVSGGAAVFTVTHRCPADQNNDGRVSPADFNAWIINFNAGC